MKMSLKLISLSMIVSLLYPNALHSQSPDRNPTEHLWDVEERKICTMDDEPVP